MKRNFVILGESRGDEAGPRQTGGPHIHEIGLVLFALLAYPVGAGAQTWNWTYQSVDASATFTSVAVDQGKNVHLTYAGDGGSTLKYAFRAAGSNRWFTMVLDQQLQVFATSLALDPQGNPHICYTPRELKYARWDGRQWSIQKIAPGGGSVEYNCTIVVGSDGAPQVLWYQTRSPDGSNFLHLRHAVLKDGVWLARTVDLDREDGKWNSMVLDAQGNPSIIYSVFPPGDLKYAYWDGKNWDIGPGIAGAKLSAGMGNSLVLTPEKQLEFSFYEAPVTFQASGEGSLKFARQKGTTWSVETVDSALQRGGWVGFRSSLVLDTKGAPHISYEDGGALKHAYWDGTRWHVQVVVPKGTEAYLYNSMAIDRDDTLYISYRDSSDGSLRVAVGSRATDASTATKITPEKPN
jgi:hypothetical protein